MALIFCQSLGHIGVKVGFMASDLLQAAYTIWRDVIDAQPTRLTLLEASEFLPISELRIGGLEALRVTKIGNLGTHGEVLSW